MSEAKRLIPIKEWAKRIYGEFAPHRNTLLKWAHEGLIQPQPEKNGNRWFCQPFAQYKGD